MKKEVLKHFEHIDLTIIAFFIFFTVFIAMIVWINRRGSKDLYKYSSSLPLADGERNER